MNESLKSLITQNNFSTSCGLSSIKRGCPWKIYEGLTVGEFIDENFSPLKKHTNIFHDLIKSVCLDIVFIETFVEKLQRKYWFCIYYFGDDDKRHPRYFIGGEPEKTIKLSASLADKSSLNEYPNSLIEFWKIHGLWITAVNYGKADFGISSLSKYFIPEEGEGNVPHFSSLSATGGEIGIADWTALSDDYVCVEFDDINIDEDTFDFSYFIKQHLKKGIYFHENNGDAILLVEPYLDSPHFFYLCHDSCSNFYTFWEYLTVDFSWLLNNNA